VREPLDVGVTCRALLGLVVVVGLAGEDGERSEPPAAGAAEGRLDVVEKALTATRLESCPVPVDALHRCLS
jgi:hypothetical protein